MWVVPEGKIGEKSKPESRFEIKIKKNYFRTEVTSQRRSLCATMGPHHCSSLGNAREGVFSI